MTVKASHKVEQFIFIEEQFIFCCGTIFFVGTIEKLF